MMIKVRLSLLFVLCAACTVGEDPGEDSVAGDGVVSEPAPSSDPASIEARVCATGTTTMGVDVSYYQGTVDWGKAYTAGVRFAFIRLSDGTVFRDPKFVQNWANAKTAGVIRGAYQFFRPNQSATAQADMMIAAIGTYQTGDLPPVIDVEATGSLSPSSVAARVRTWVDRVQAALGVTPIVYTGKYFWRDQVGGPTSFAPNALWIAQYTSQCPDLPAPWLRWTFWQHTDSGHVNGISGNVDMNKFNGDLTALLAFAGGMASTTPPPPPPPVNGCVSQTLNHEVTEGTCVQSASDQQWYTCTAGAWVSRSSSSGCAAAYGWCDSATLGRKVPPRSCVEASSDNTWYQCDGHGWVDPVDYTAQSGPAGLCSEMHQL
jgi:lysozyme